MATNQLLKRYLDAGMQFTQLNQKRAEAIVRDLVKTGEVQAEQAQATVLELLERSRKNSEKLLEQVRSEVKNQLAVAEFVTKDVVGKLQAQIDELRAQIPGLGAATVKTTPAKPKKAAATKAPAKKAGAKKAGAKKAAAKKAAAKKSAS